MAAPTRRSGRLMSVEDVSSATNIGLNISGIAPQSTGQPTVRVFRFLDLPAELRGRVYSFAVQPEHGTNRNLRYFKQPSITAVSKQLRHESLPILFSDCPFRLVIGSNARIFRGYASWDRHNSGTLGIKRAVKTSLLEVGDAAIFRDVTFHICPVGEHAQHRDRATDGQYSRYPSLRVTTQPGVVCTIKKGVYHGSNIAQVEQQEERKVLAKAEAVAEEIGKEDGFKGLRLSDLDRIAKCFRA